LVIIRDCCDIFSNCHMYVVLILSLFIDFYYMNSVSGVHVIMFLNIWSRQIDENGRQAHERRNVPFTHHTAPTHSESFLHVTSRTWRYHWELILVESWKIIELFHLNDWWKWNVVCSSPVKRFFGDTYYFSFWRNLSWWWVKKSVLNQWIIVKYII